MTQVLLHKTGGQSKSEQDEISNSHPAYLNKFVAKIKNWNVGFEVYVQMRILQVMSK